MTQAIVEAESAFSEGEVPVGAVMAGSDGRILARSHNQPITLNDPTAMQPAFDPPDVGPEGEALTFQLTVTDSGGLKDTDTCIVNVVWVNTPPVADAGPDQEVNEGILVFLYGYTSTAAV